MFCISIFTFLLDTYSREIRGFDNKEMNYYNCIKSNDILRLLTYIQLLIYVVRLSEF